MRRLCIVVSVGVILCALALSGCKVVQLDEEGNPIGVGDTFDPVAYVDGIWDSSVLPTVRERAVDLPVLLEAITANSDTAKEQYGRQAAAGSAYNFLVKGEGRVLGVETSNMLVDLAPFDGEKDVAVRLGPAFTGTEIRDSLEFIRFNDFKNVLEYADVSNQLNARVRSTVVNLIDKETVAGKQIAFYGAFALKDPNNIVIIPVILEVTG